jgi:hypothetical protein
MAHHLANLMFNVGMIGGILLLFMALIGYTLGGR